MLIRTQNKKEIINSERISSIYVEGEKVFARNATGNGSFELGEYLNEEEALKVIDKIEGAWLDCCRVESRYSEDANGNVDYTVQENNIYYMPQKGYFQQWV